MRRPSFTKRPFLRTIGSVVVALVLAGCASLPAPPAGAVPRPAPAPAADASWWYARFRMEWPEGADPAWHRDLLIAHRVVKPVLDRHAQDIALWRFHRRAARDEAGHQFSFIFYASAGTARRVFLGISSNPLLEQANASGRAITVVCDDPSAGSLPAVADASDPAWSAPLRQAWPYYLMGASQMWLDLVCRMARGDQPAGSPPTFDDLDERYAGTSADITALWQNEGRHAFLHHLNALFGYEPIVVVEKRLMRF
jgi:hypothetical protein